MVICGKIVWQLISAQKKNRIIYQKTSSIANITNCHRIPLTELNASTQGLKSYKWDWDGMRLDGPLNALLLKEHRIAVLIITCL